MASKYHKYIKRQDIGNDLTELELSKLEKRIREVYSEASAEIQAELNQYVEAMKVEERRWLNDLKEKRVTQEEFDHWKKLQFTQGQRWIDEKEHIANVLYNSNVVANAMVNDAMIDIFALNGNYAAYKLEKTAGVNLTFSLYNQTTVKKLLRDDARILPSKKIKKIKDKRWNFQNIKKEVAKGIIKGESVSKIASRLADEMPNRNEAMLKTHARTMVTSAQNQGRMARYHEAQDKGIDLQKEWISTLSARTRYTHAALDGQVKDIDEPFEIDGFEIMEPGDPSADPSMVYNCRCRMDSVLKKYPREYRERRDADTGELYSDMTFFEWYESKGGNIEDLKGGKKRKNK